MRTRVLCVLLFLFLGHIKQLTAQFIARNDTILVFEDATTILFPILNDTYQVGHRIEIKAHWGFDNHVAFANVINGTDNINYQPIADYYGFDTIKYNLCNIFNICSEAIIYIEIINLSDEPEAFPDTFYIYEDTDSTFQILDNDFDPDGDPMFIQIPTPTVNGVLSVDDNLFDDITYTPNENFFGTDSFYYFVCDNEDLGLSPLCSDTVPVIIYILPVNDPPVAVNDVNTINEDQYVCKDVLANDIEVDGENLVLTSILSGSIGNGTIVNNQFCYTPEGNFNGVDTLFYVVCDDSGIPSSCDTGRYIINILPINDPPTAVDDQVNVNEDLNICVSVLANDFDVDGNIFSITGIINPQHGTVTVQNGIICYEPADNYNGPDVITYIICDNGTPVLCDTGLLFINVIPVNDPPIAINDVSTINEDQNFCFNVLGNDIELDGENLVLTSVINGSLGNGTIVNNQLCYNPDDNVNGVDTLFYVVCDNSGIPNSCDTGRYIINILPINDAPLAVDDPVEVLEDSIICIPVLDNDVNNDGDVITVTIIDMANFGTTVLQNGIVCYEPNENYNGQDTIRYLICDNGVPVLCDTGLIIINVIPVNDPPIAINDVSTINEDQNFCFNVLANDIELDGENLVLTSVINGSLGNGTIVNNQLCYNPDDNVNGVDTLFYVVCDNSGIPNSCDTGRYIINILPINDAPLAVDDPVEVLEDSIICIPVLNNDINVDQDVITVTIIDMANFGTTVLQNGIVCYEPNENYNGQDTIRYLICDNGVPVLCDTGLIIINVIPVADSPIANDDNAQTDLNSPILIDVTNNDIDIDGNGIVITIINGPSHGTAIANDTAITYTPNDGYQGVDTIIYIACNAAHPNLCDTAIVVITIGLINEVIANDDSISIVEDQDPVTINILANDFFPLGNSVVISGPINGPFHGTAVVTNGNVITYTPNSNFNGIDSFQYIICLSNNNQICDTAWVVITVTPLPDSPIANDDTANTIINTPVLVNVINNDIDIDGNGIQITIIDGPNNGTAIANDTAIIYTPNQGFLGYDTITYIACNAIHPTLCDTAFVIILVSELNYPPVAVNDTVFVLTDEISIDVLANDSDPNGDELSFVILDQPELGSVTISNGVVIYTLYDNNSYGQDSFTYILCDNDPIEPLCDTATVYITVIHVPNSFTPNGDGINDEWIISGIELFPNNSLTIFNRWGEIVFEVEKYENNWSGQLGDVKRKIGSNVPEGTYFYLLKLADNIDAFKGYVFIAR